MSRKYSLTLSEDDFRRHNRPQVSSMITAPRKHEPSVISSLVYQYEKEEQMKSDRKEKNQISLSQQTDNTLLQQNLSSFNKTVRPNSYPQLDSYKRFSDSRYFNWEDTIGASSHSSRVEITRNSGTPRTFEDERGCALCRLARDALDKKTIEEKQKKEEFGKQMYQSEHCRQLELLEKLLR